MSVCSSWIHGNALTIEDPVYIHPDGRIVGRLILRHFGWGAQVTVEGSPRGSWIHLPIPAINDPVTRFRRFDLVRVFLLFECSDASINDVHIYDGHQLIEAFNFHHARGSFLVKGYAENTFKLKKPHHMKSGVGISFLFMPEISVDRPENERRPEGRLLVTAAGAEFDKSNIFFSFPGHP